MCSVITKRDSYLVKWSDGHKHWESSWDHSYLIVAEALETQRVDARLALLKHVSASQLPDIKSYLYFQLYTSYHLWFPTVPRPWVRTQTTPAANRLARQSVLTSVNQYPPRAPPRRSRARCFPRRELLSRTRRLQRFRDHGTRRRFDSVSEMRNIDDFGCWVAQRSSRDNFNVVILYCIRLNSSALSSFCTFECSSFWSFIAGTLKDCRIEASSINIIFQLSA